MKMDDMNEIKYSGYSGNDYVCYKQIVYMLHDIKYIRA